MPRSGSKGLMGDVVFTSDDCVLEVPGRMGILVAREVRVKSMTVRGMRCHGKNMLVELDQAIDE